MVTNLAAPVLRKVEGSQGLVTLAFKIYGVLQNS